MSRRRLSPSALGRFRTCPKQFRLVDVERMRPSERGSPILTQGNAVHDALDRFFGLPQEERQPENLERALRAVWPNHRTKDTFSGREEERDFGVQALKMLNQFGETHDLAATPLAREQWVSTVIGGVSLFGKIDRVDRASSGGLILTDYKTGRSILEQGDLKHEPAVQVYVCAAESEWRLPVELLRFVYLSHGTTVEWAPEREDVTDLRRRLEETVAAIAEETLWEARPGDWCRFCAARLHCADRQRVRLEDLVPVEGLPF
jgi:RecB family exonuclease